MKQEQAIRNQAWLQRELDGLAKITVVGTTDFVVGIRSLDGKKLYAVLDGNDHPKHHGIFQHRVSYNLVKRDEFRSTASMLVLADIIEHLRDLGA